MDQLGGPALWWPWVELAVVQLPQGGPVLAARRAGGRRDSLGPGCGMLFRFEAPEPHGFWMKNTHMPLDILFVDAGGTVLNVAEQAEPLRLKMHCSAGPVTEVLEVPGGWSAAHGVGAGAQLSVMNSATPPAGPGT